ncbi:MAG: carbohydrate kinase [Alphaproteobacteria bacterium]|nr:carbohydrate kinase [Alphaproteobacteria bacterium]
MSVVLGLDIGTTSTIGILIRLPDRVIATASRPVRLSAPHPGWAEEDPREWWSNVAEIVRELMARIAPEELKAIGVTGMLPAVVLLDEKGDLLRPSIQQSDGRCGAEVEGLKREIDEKDFLRRAGNGINQQLLAPKLRWLAAHEPEVFRRIATVFGSYDYVNWKLTGVRAVEQNWALEAGFTDLASHAIAADLVALAGIPRSALPPRSASHQVLGRVTAAAAKETGLPEGVPVVGGAADLIASALGAGVAKSGDVLLKFGGSVDVLIATDKAAPDPRLYLDYHLVPGLFMPNGCMATGGSGLNWFVDTFGAGRTHRTLDVLAGQIPAGSEGVAILPYLLGEKTPIHDPDARGAFTGLTLAHGIGHLWRALLEAYAYAIRHHIEVLNEIGHPTERYLASDGGSSSEVWMHIVADVLQAPVQRLSGHPGSCLGAAWTAAIGCGLTDDWMGVTRFVSKSALVWPNPANAAVYREGYARFRDLYRRLG